MPIRLTTEKFIEKAKLKHGNRCDYSKVIYEGSKNNVIIICKDHGEFKQIPNNHLNGSNCPDCVGLKPLTTEMFIEKARKIHKDVYSYQLVNYINYTTPIIIVCKNHGEFKQVPSYHLRGESYS